jgi:hypothetical protein
VDRVDQAFRSRLEKQPEEPVRLIVRVAGEIAQAEQRLAELGANVLRSFSLTKAVAVSCSAATALSLLEESWVQSIEEDRQVTAQSSGEDDASCCGGQA